MNLNKITNEDAKKFSAIKGNMPDRPTYFDGLFTASLCSIAFFILYNPGELVLIEYVNVGCAFFFSLLDLRKHIMYRIGMNNVKKRLDSLLDALADKVS